VGNKKYANKNSAALSLFVGLFYGLRGGFRFGFELRFVPQKFLELLHLSQIFSDQLKLQGF